MAVLPLDDPEAARLRAAPYSYGPIALRNPCRVVYVVNESDERGFAYGTLPGHPEAGEERFLLRRHEGGRIELTVSAFSRPASALARAGGPLSQKVQDAMTLRYLRALDQA
jgi:uncharacterized protein (UPF0548 family)